MKASLIIPTYNREDALVNTIENCLSQDFKDLEIVVIDQTKQHQTDTTKYIESIKKRIIYTNSKGNLEIPFTLFTFLSTNKINLIKRI